MIAIDLGSNTIRAVEYDCKENKKIKEFEKIVRTADNLVNTKNISKDAINRIIDAINEMKDVLDFNKHQIKAIATQALRQADNKDEVVNIIKDKTGIEFEVISADKEAQYTAIATSECLKRCNIEDNNHFLLVDIGGGSTELILKKRDIITSKSIRLGIVVITEEYKTPEAIKLAIKKRVKRLKDFIDFSYATYRKPKIFVASSGTPTTIAALKIGLNYKTYDPDKINGVKLTINDLNFWEDKLLKMDMKKREELVGVGRGDLIISGIYIFKEIFKLAGYKECVVCDDGVREGVAISECKKLI